MALSIGEIDRVARLICGTNSKLSAWPILFLMQLSITKDWQALTSVVRKIDNKPTRGNLSYITNVLVKLELIEMKKGDSKGSQFPPWICRLNPSLHTIKNESYDGEKVRMITSLTQYFMQKKRRTSTLLILVLLAIKIRKINSVEEVKMFCGGHYMGNSSHQNILDALAEMGVIQMVKTAEYRRAPVMIFEVENS